MIEVDSKFFYKVRELFMLEIVIGILLLCLVTYTIFAGADLGTGILEIFISKKDDNSLRDIFYTCSKARMGGQSYMVRASSYYYFYRFSKSF